MYSYPDENKGYSDDGYYKTAPASDSYYIKHLPTCKFHFDSFGDKVYDCNCTHEYEPYSYIGDPPTDEEREYDSFVSYICSTY